MKTNISIKLLNIVFLIGLLILLVWLAISDINPSGERIITHGADQPSNLVTGPEPPDRVIGEYGEYDNKYWEIAVDPIYFDLYIPRLYQQVTMEVIYQSERQDIVELGGLGSGTGWQITLKPGENEYINKLDWPCVRFGDIAICQNREIYGEEFAFQNIFDFIEIAATKDVITYHYIFPIEVNFNEQKWSQGKNFEEYDYFVTSYKVPEYLDDNWKKISAKFSANELWLSGHIYKFMISAPELDSNSGRIRVKQVKFILNKEPITLENFKIKLKRFWQRNISKFGI